LSVVNRWLLAQAMEGETDGALQLVCMERTAAEKAMRINTPSVTH
jgi:hypothetical protein